MKLHLADVILWAILFIAEAIFAVVILKKNAARRWPFLLALVLFDILYYSLIATQIHSRSHYFYTYWYSQGVRSLLSMGLLWDIFRKFPELKYVPKSIGLTLLSVGLTVTIGSVILTTLHHPNTTYKITYEVLMINECVAVLWMGAALSLLHSISRLGLGWGLESVNIAAGAVVFGLAAMLAASSISSWPQYGHVFDKLQTCIEIAVFLSWIKTLCRPSVPDAPLSDSALNAITEFFEEHPLKC